MLKFLSIYILQLKFSYHIRIFTAVANLFFRVNFIKRIVNILP